MICCCSLAGTRACFYCSRHPYQPEPSISQPIIPCEFGIERPKRIIEKYEDGKLIERIVEQ